MTKPDFDVKKFLGTPDDDTLFSMSSFDLSLSKPMLGYLFSKVKDNEGNDSATNMLFELLEKETGGDVIENVARLLTRLLGYTIEYGSRVALSACQVLSMLSIKAKEKKKEYLATDFRDLSSAYEQRAIGVMDACYKEDMLATEDLLRMKLKGWVMKSPLTCANETTLDFLDHTCCDNIRTKIWKGEYHLKSASSLR
ncbi:hypothetical protein LSAT2_003794 [Lamellibrachia satsuma]|nr:hypothetical protein LSAT2_003794 [Lamellibrachia satsuma]